MIGDMMSPRTTGPETVSRILDAAADCFAKDGYEGTGVAQICAAAGVSKGAFYHHFPSKQTAFLALLNRWLAVLDSYLESARSGASDIPEALRQIAGLSHLVFQSAGGQLPMFLEFWTQSAHDPQVWHATIAPYQRYRDFFQRLVEQGTETGAFRGVDPAVVGPILVALAVGVLLQGLMDPDGADWAGVLEEGIMILMRGMQGEG
jgi:AcrR family transcriptional regulator